MKSKRNKAYSLLEMMLVVALIGILMAAGIPMYKNYTRKARYTEIVQAAAPLKLAVTQCYQFMEDLAGCSNGENGIPSATSYSGDNLIQSITVQNGIITVTPNKKFGIENSDTYILSPHIIDHNIKWRKQGGGIKKGYTQ